MTDLATFSRQLADLQQRIATAATAAGRDPQSVKLLAVSKTLPAEAVGTALQAGLTRFGESRVQEALPKMAELGELPESQGMPVEWHLIGHLQKNKVAKAIGPFALIHSVDSAALAARISRIAGEKGVVQDVLIQINASAEPQKYGIPVDQALAVVRQAGTLPHIRVRGLMGMAAQGNPEPAFATLKELFDTLAESPPHGVEMAELSMGMSGDFEAAIRHGATIVRIGSGLFGARDR